MALSSDAMEKKQMCVGLVAHVDAGKTTLAEALLFLTGEIRKAGRVDHKDAYLDTDVMEKERGITIFSKQAVISCEDRIITLLDTPGHVDFSAEMERSLQVMGAAILVISGADGVQGHVETLWRLLDRYHIPVFLFINKMDQEGTDQQQLMKELQKNLSDHCIDFSVDRTTDAFLEEVAVCEEDALEEYLEKGSLSDTRIRSMIAERKIFPCSFGSALKMEGIEEFWEMFLTFTSPGSYPENFGARVYKITRDPAGNRLTHLKVTGGVLKVKEMLSGEKDGEPWQEKVDQIRVYSGASYHLAPEVPAGSICAVTGLSHTVSGEGLGTEKETKAPLLEPVLNYQIQLPEGTDVHGMLRKLKMLEEEIPELHIVWKEQLSEIHAQVMGEIQMEILERMIRERFGVAVIFGAGHIVYKETIRNTVEGVGHFEPLRHYAEVHLFLEPGEPGSGLVFETDCREDVLDRNWQRLILTHLEEKKHLGVLTGSEITDMKITLVSGRAHQKHTEGGDFREATYRAVRQGLKKAESVLLEPVYEYRLEIPTEATGRALHDLERMCGTFLAPEVEDHRTVIRGTAPVATMREYPREVISYTKGRGRIFCTLKGYEPCHNQEEVIAEIGYDSERDLENPTGSVFCAHGAGFPVPWDEVETYMHLEAQTGEESIPEGMDGISGKELSGNKASGKKKASDRVPLPSSLEEEKELEEIFTRTYGPVERKRAGFERKTRPVPQGEKTERPYRKKETAPRDEYLLVDGYNIIFSWDDLRELARGNLESARGKLMDLLCDYQGYKNMTLILVFDAYKVKENRGEVQKYHNIYVVYTKEAETADQYIEKAVHKIGHQNNVTVASSDGLEQVIILGAGARRLSARELLEEMMRSKQELKEAYLDQNPKGRHFLGEHVPEDTF